MKLREGLYLIPDLAVFYPSEPPRERGHVPETPPLVAVEILSPDDRLNEVREKLEQYRSWGVPHVWLIDPHARRMYTCEAGLTEVPTLKIVELGLEVRPGDIFD
jgi:Uma2 family endonuclease